MPSSTTRRPCSGCHKPTKRAAGVCVHCDPAIPEGHRKPAAKRPERACRGCGKRTTAKVGLCKECVRENETWEEPSAEHALKGGWVQRGLVRVWDPTATPWVA